MKTKANLKDFQINLQSKISPNGIKFIHFSKPNAPISIKISSRSGSRFDPEQKSGLAHFVEHIVLDGTEKYPNKKDLSLSFDDLGGSYSAHTGTEFTRFDFLVAKKENLGFIADVIDQIVNKSLLKEKDIELEKNIVKTEITSKSDSVRRILSNGIEKLMFGDNPIANNISGTEETVTSITRDDVIFHLKNTFPQDLTVVSCGSCDVEEIYDLFNPVLPFNKFKLDSKPPEISSGLKYGSYKLPDQKTVSCILAFPTSGIATDNDVALSILSLYLGRSRSSLLREVLRYNEGLLYSVTTRNIRYSDTGYLYIGFGVKKENLAVVISKIKDTLASLLDVGIEERLLGIIKNKIVNHSIISTQTVQFWTDTHFYRELLVRDNKYTYVDFMNDVTAISKDKVDEVIKKYLRPENMFLYAVGNVEESEIGGLFE